MKLRELLISTAMISLTFVLAEAVTPTLPSPLIAEDEILGSAYYDTLSILESSNECSDFFGGSTVSVEAFNSLVSRVRKGYFAPSLGIQMSGETVDVFNIKTKSRYRFFDKVVINTNGPFYRKRFSRSDATVPGIGKFGPNTKEVRVLMFLHELGHVVQGEGGEWRLPNDGNDDKQSRSNTKKIESVCGDQIKNLSKVASAVNSGGRQKKPEELVTPVNTTP